MEVCKITQDVERKSGNRSDGCKPVKLWFKLSSVFLSFFVCLCVRKLIEGEDSRLGTMVQSLSLTGGLQRPSSDSKCALSAPSKLGGSLSDTSGNSTERAAGAGRIAAASSDIQADGNLEKQATVMSKRKTVLIR